MDVKDFLRDLKRMCDSHDGSCIGCPGNLTPKDGCRLRILRHIDISEAEVNAVEKWSKENPFVTNRQIVEEVFGSDSKILIAMPSNWLDLEYHDPKCKEEDEDETYIE